MNRIKKALSYILVLGIIISTFSPIQSNAATVEGSLGNPMTLWGTLVGDSQNMPAGTVIEFQNDGAIIGSMTTTQDGQYGNNGAQGGDIALQQFTNNLTIIVKVGGSSYTVSASQIDDTARGAGCPELA